MSIEKAKIFQIVILCKKSKMYMMEINRKSVLFYDLDLKIIKVDVFNKVITCKSCFAETLKVGNIFVQPDGLCKVKLIADLLQRPKNFVGTGISTVICDAGILEHMVVFKYSCPKPKHVVLILCRINGFC